MRTTLSENFLLERKDVWDLFLYETRAFEKEKVDLLAPMCHALFLCKYVELLYCVFLSIKVNKSFVILIGVGSFIYLYVSYGANTKLQKRALGIETQLLEKKIALKSSTQS